MEGVERETEVETEVEVPSYFVCPISLEIMRDPVILPSGITYDRPSIERWIFADGSTTCPVTRLPLPLPLPLPPPADGIGLDLDLDLDLDLVLTPNHTLRRLIQAWSALHAAERFPTPKPPADRRLVSKLLEESDLRRLRALASESERSRRCVESTPGAVEFLASSVVAGGAERDVAIDVLASLRLSERRLAEMVESRPEFVDSLTGVLRRPYDAPRAHAVAVLRSLAGALSPARLAAAASEELFGELARALQDRVATKAALQALVELAPWGRNRVKAANAGAVGAVVEILLDDEGGEGRTCELALAAVERMCGCAEGRAALAGHPAGLAAVAKKALRVSPAATERAVRALCLVARHAPSAAVLAEMASVGAVAKLCLVLQSDCADRTKQRVRDVLRLHSRVWRASPCLSPHFLALYPPPPPSSSSSSSSSSSCPPTTTQTKR